MEDISVDTRLSGNRHNWSFVGDDGWHQDHTQIIYPPVWSNPGFERGKGLVPDLYCYELAREDHAFLTHILDDVDISVEYRSMYGSVVQGGIIFRAESSSCFYVLDIFDKARKGQYYEFKLWAQDKNGYRHELAGGTARHSVVPEHIIQEGAKTRADWDISGPDWLRLRIQASGTYIRVSAEGKVLFDLRDSTYREGYTGLTARGPVLFRDLAVTGTRGKQARAWEKHEVELPRFFYIDDRKREGFNAFPVICGSGAGIMYTAWSYASKDPRHPFGNEIAFSHTEDSGRTWSTPRIIFSAGKDGEICHPTSIFAHVDGSISCLINIWGKGHIVLRSVNGGASWENEGPFTAGKRSDTQAIRTYLYSPMKRLADGTVIMTGFEADETYGKDASLLRDRSLLFRSTDDGRTWNDPAYFDMNNHDHNECMIAETAPGNLIAFMRSLRAPNMWTCRSEDGGMTWTPLRQTDIGGECPYIMRHSSGKLLMFNRENGVFMKTSGDDGLTWTKETRISPASAMIGMVETDDRSILIVLHEGYGIPGHIRAQFFRISSAGLEPAG